MVTGFENYTSPLSETDRREIAPTLARELAWHKGKGLAIKNAELRAKMRSRGYYVADAKMRALINYIRINKLCERVVASERGYYVAESAEELDRYCNSLREREASIRAVRQALEAQNTRSLFG